MDLASYKTLLFLLAIVEVEVKIICKFLLKQLLKYFTSQPYFIV